MEPKNMAIGMISLSLIALTAILTMAVGIVAGADMEMLLALKDVVLVIVGGIAGALTTNRYFTPPEPDRK